MRRPLLAVLAVAALAAGCGDDAPTDATEGTDTTEVAAPDDLASTDLADVDVSGEVGEPPVLDFPQPFGVTESTSRVIEEGDGEEISPNSIVSFDFVFVNGRDAAELSTSYDTEPSQLAFEESLMAGIYDGLNGVPTGSRVLVAISPTDRLGAEDTEGVLASDTLLFVADVHDVRVPLARAEGEAVEPAAGLPTVELADDGAPTITVPDADPPAELVVQPLIEGDGAVVEAGQTITVHYTGVIWDTGAVFDSSWERGAPSTFQIGAGAVIPGWDEGLVGQTVGSQILLVIPPAKGYPEGSPDGSIKGTDTIVFVVDILAAG
jgi:peptidylprolyl isomerase